MAVKSGHENIGVSTILGAPRLGVFSSLEGCLSTAGRGYQQLQALMLRATLYTSVKIFYLEQSF